MVAVPAEAPQTTPVNVSTVAITGLLLLHVPEGVELARVVQLPTHIVGVPGVIGGVDELTVTAAVARQPVAVRV
jgi:hypothetical protein